MQFSNRRGFGMALLAGATTLSAAAIMMGQTPGQPQRDQPPGKQRPEISRPESSRPEVGMSRNEYFVTGDANHASLWMRDGTSLRWLSSADSNKLDRDIKAPAEPRNPTDRPPPK